MALVRAVERIDRGVVVVAAAGNHNAMTAVGGVGPAKASSFADLPSWPAALGDVLAVGAVYFYSALAAPGLTPEEVSVVVLGITLPATVAYELARRWNA